MKRIFHVITHFDVGGAERIAVNIATSTNSKLEYHIVELVRSYSKFSKTFIRELEESGVRYHRFYIPHVRFHYLFERLAALLFPLWFCFIFKKYKPSVIHSHTEMPDLAVFLFFHVFPGWQKRCKIVRTIHNSCLWTGQKRTGRYVERFFRQHINVGISKSVTESYKKVYGLLLPIVYNGVAPVAQKTYPYLKEGVINILFAGRLEHEKGIDVLQQIILSLREDKRFFFHVFGSGSLSKELDEALAKCPNVSINPPLFCVSQYMGSFDYMIMPSEFEGLGIISIEASFNGLPTIINSCPGLYETLPNDWPLKVNNNSLGEYMDIFTKTLLQVNRKDICKQAYSYVNQQFSIEQMRKGYEVIYMED